MATEILPDYYAILGVESSAERSVIKAAYRDRAKTCHPDHGGSHEQMVLINEAWEILGDQEHRQKYDAVYRGVQEPDESFAQDLASASERARTYPSQWVMVEKWIENVTADFQKTEWDPTPLSFQPPVPKHSVSGHVFVTGGGVIGVVVAIWLFPYRPLPKTTILEFEVRFVFPAASTFLGMWIGKWAHGVVRRSLEKRRR